MNKYYGIQKGDFDISFAKSVKDIYGINSILQVEGLLLHLLKSQTLPTFRNLQTLLNSVFKEPSILTFNMDYVENGSLRHDGIIVMCQYDIEFLAKYGSLKPSRLYTMSHQIGSMDSFNSFTGVKVDYMSYLYSRFYDKWSKLVALYSTPYDAIKPYNMHLSESMTDDLETTIDENNSESENSTYGFNNDESVPTSKSKSKTTRSFSRENPTSREYDRVGTTGNIPLSELVEKEREKLRFIIVDEIYKDIASVIGRGTYN